MVKVSIITPTLNRPNFLLENIRSVSNSVLVPIDIELEHVVIDLNDNNKTKQLLEKNNILNNNPYLNYIQYGKRLLPSQARNLAISKASGEYIIVLDDDDILLQRTVHNFIELLRTSKKCRWAYSSFIKCDKELRYLQAEDYYGWQYANASEMLSSIFNGDHYMQGNVIFEKSLFEEVGRYDETLNMAEDLDLYIRFLLKTGLPGYNNFNSHIHRVHDANLSKDITKDIHKFKAREFKNKYFE